MDGLIPGRIVCLVGLTSLIIRGWRHLGLVVAKQAPDCFCSGALPFTPPRNISAEDEPEIHELLEHRQDSR